MGDTHNELTGDVHGVVYQARTMNFFAERAAPALSGLPRPEPDFTGRALELTRLAESLRPDQGDRAVVVSAVAGLGGVGKTTLAIKAAHDAVEAGWFPGGVLFLNLHGYSPEGRVELADALATLLRDLGAPVPPNLAGRESLYRTELAKRTEPMLILLDNASSSDQVRPLLPNSSAHRVLVTSRHSLGDLGATPIDLNVLDDADTAKLVENSLRTRLPDDRRVRDEPPAVALLGELCGHLPLALGIATSMLADDPEMPISELVDALRGETTRLKELVYSENLAVRAAFDLSFHRLTEAQQRMFALLALHPGKQVGVRSAAALADVPVREARRTLDDLRRAHMVLPGKPRGWFRFHDLVRLYAVDHASRLPDRDDAVRRLLQNYYETSLSAYEWTAGEAEKPNAFSDFRGALDWFDTERPSFRPVIDLAYESGHYHHVRTISLVTTKSWMLRGADSDLVHLYEVAIRAGRAMGDRTAEMVLLLNLGRAHSSTGNFTGAENALLLGSDRAVVEHSAELTSACDAELGYVRIKQGRHQEGIGLLERSLAAGPQTPGVRSHILGMLAHAHAALDDRRKALEYRQLALAADDRPLRTTDHATNLVLLAGAHTALGETDRGGALLEEALEIHQELGHHRGQLNLLSALAEHHAAVKRYDLETRYRQQRLALFADGELSGERADSMRALGVSLVNSEQYAEAADRLRTAAAMYSDLDLRAGEAKSLDWLSTAEHRQQNHVAATRAAHRALALFRELEDHTGWSFAARAFSTVLRDSGQFDEAQRLLEEVLAHHEAHGQKQLEAEVHQDLGRLHNKRKDFPAAIHQLTTAAEKMREVGNQAAEANLLIYLSNVHSNNRNGPAALATAREGLALAQSLGLAELEGWGLLRLGRALVGVDDHTAAIEALTRALPHHAGKSTESAARYHLGLAHRELGNYPAARRELSAALDVDQVKNDPYDVGMVLQQMGLLHRDEGDVAEARRLGEQAVQLLTEAGEPSHVQRVRAWLDEL